MFSGLNIFLENRDVNSKRSIVRSQSPVRIDGMVIIFQRFGLRNTRSMTEFKFCWLSKYLVGTCSVGLDSSKCKESATSIRISLWMEWYRKCGSQLLSLILKFLVIMRTLLILTSVFLRYFKAAWDKSEYILIRK